MKQPTKEEVISKLLSILQGSLSREEVADWASEIVMQDEPIVTDEEVWELLKITSGVDIKDSPDEYLHVEQDIMDWINKFKS
ncbi:DNA-binding protein [Paenibacillus melissococcoides]|uniref:DNA-binding protein n=1 Tax=Paenibacillus melissococcoides TaxID=2912268 RepID=A0ABM9G322_9BACL|nr:MULTISPECIES: DNA-binding protein [Paenibacillus]MEB9893265.1 DNA-binding protein [Bacillus cereus]CAH8246062.1 DNA-binding protein [Paenibacillus melissococcoides]CAH8712862.1 DNA-binding protein [Paenibacillus melissococcoides]CAH8713628.1 DNA-binding protein [Paenibacillus melissococcoides]GIO78743.1 hypothetical protein J6TS7_23530 [Paenibacillus dendritiformis]